MFKTKNFFIQKYLFYWMLLILLCFFFSFISLLFKFDYYNNVARVLVYTDDLEVAICRTTVVFLFWRLFCWKNHVISLVVVVVLLIYLQIKNKLSVPRESQSRFYSFPDIDWDKQELQLINQYNKHIHTYTLKKFHNKTSREQLNKSIFRK